MALKHNDWDVFNNTSVKKESDWLLEKVFVFNIDKTTNNICEICIQHIWTQTFFKLQGKKFIPCMNDKNWVFIEETTNTITNHYTELALKIQWYQSPYHL
jgi:hypothetical protein